MTALEPAAPAAVPRRTGTFLDLDAIRADLEEQRRFRSKQLNELDSAVTPTAANGARDEVASALRTAAIIVLAEIEAALRRIELDCYGLCERCGDAIPGDRLEALPMASLCMPCQYALEVDRSDWTHQPSGQHSSVVVADQRSRSKNHPGPRRRTSRSPDVVDQWGAASFPASDPPQNW
jgi:RNA polymerase-binding transcription factor DksA